VRRPGRILVVQRPLHPGTACGIENAQAASGTFTQFQALQKGKVAQRPPSQCSSNVCSTHQGVPQRAQIVTTALELIPLLLRRGRIGWRDESSWHSEPSLPFIIMKKMHQYRIWNDMKCPKLHSSTKGLLGDVFESPAGQIRTVPSGNPDTSSGDFEALEGRVIPLPISTLFTPSLAECLSLRWRAQDHSSQTCLGNPEHTVITPTTFHSLTTSRRRNRKRAATSLPTKTIFRDE